MGDLNSPWLWVDAVLIPLAVLAFWLMLWDISTQAKRRNRFLTVLLARDRSADLNWQLFADFYGRRAREIALAREGAEVAPVGLHSVRVEEAVR